MTLSVAKLSSDRVHDRLSTLSCTGIEMFAYAVHQPVLHIHVDLFDVDRQGSAATDAMRR